MRKSLFEYGPAMLAGWWAVVIGVGAGGLGLLLRIWTEPDPPLWVWIGVMVGGISVAQFLAFHKLREKRDALTDKPSVVYAGGGGGGGGTGASGGDGGDVIVLN